MNMDELRGQIDAIDSQLVELYKQRLDVADRIGAAGLFPYQEQGTRKTGAEFCSRM